MRFFWLLPKAKKGPALLLLPLWFSLAMVLFAFFLQGAQWNIFEQKKVEILQRNIDLEICKILTEIYDFAIFHCEWRPRIVGMGQMGKPANGLRHMTSQKKSRQWFGRPLLLRYNTWHKLPLLMSRPHAWNSPSLRFISFQRKTS